MFITKTEKKIPPNITNVSKDMERLEDFCTTGGNVKEYSHMKIVYSISAVGTLKYFGFNFIVP